MNVADCPGANDVDEPEQVPVGLDNDWHVGPDANPPAGGCCVSATARRSGRRSPCSSPRTYTSPSDQPPTPTPELADFTIDNAGDCVAVTVAVDGGDVTDGPVGGVPVAVAESLIDP